MAHRPSLVASATASQANAHVTRYLLRSHGLSSCRPLETRGIVRFNLRADGPEEKPDHGRQYDECQCANHEDHARGGGSCREPTHDRGPGNGRADPDEGRSLHIEVGDGARRRGRTNSRGREHEERDADLAPRQEHLLDVGRGLCRTGRTPPSSGSSEHRRNVRERDDCARPPKEDQGELHSLPQLSDDERRVGAVDAGERGRELAAMLVCEQQVLAGG
jgi:hypothetical protein